MKLLKIRDNTVSLVAETVNDLHFILKIIKKGDRVRTRSFRKIKVNETDSERKSMVIEIEVEKIELIEDSKSIKLLGRITKADDSLVQLHSYHSLEIELNKAFDITKSEWNKIYLKVIEKAVKESSKALFTVLLIDEHSALLAVISPRGYTKKAEFFSQTRKSSEKFEDEIKRYEEKIINYLKNTKPEGTLIIAGPGSFKEKIAERIKSSFNKLTIAIENVSYSEEGGLRELLNSEKIANIMKGYPLIEQNKLVNAFITHLSKEKKDITYGIVQTKKALELNALNHVIIHEELLEKKDVRDFLDLVIERNIPITIIEQGSEAGEMFKTFGIAGFLSYQLEIE